MLACELLRGLSSTNIAAWCHANDMLQGVTSRLTNLQLVKGAQVVL